MGLTFGRPVITKLKDKRWVVMVTSGYNNITGSGADGKGYLYVIDAITGKLIMRLATGAGSVGSPSGLRELNYFVSNVGVRQHGAFAHTVRTFRATSGASTSTISLHLQATKPC